MTIYIVGLEQHEQRYTGEWAQHLPEQIHQALASEPVRVIEGAAKHQETTPGAFLNFSATNTFKSQQIAEIAKLFERGDVKVGDAFLFTDAWHYGIVALRYMSDLLQIPVRCVALWHAGSHDPHDFLGRIPDITWARHFERSLFEAIDVNVFATRFHIDMFKSVHSLDDDRRILRAGWPMEYLAATLAPYQNLQKCKLILFPHRTAPEKQVEIFRDLAREFPDYEFRVCQDQKLTKQEYHKLLGEAMAVFSASLQETLGIGLYEGLVCGAMPIAPDRLSYSEMYPADCLYPSEWTTDWKSYQRHKPLLVGHLNAILQRVETGQWPVRAKQIAPQIGNRYFNGHGIYRALSGEAGKITPNAARSGAVV